MFAGRPVRGRIAIRLGDLQERRRPVLKSGGGAIHVGEHVNWIEETVREMRSSMPGELYEHCVRTMETAAEIARRLGLDERACATGGLLHDYCRHLPGPELLKLAVELGIVIDDVERHWPLLLHGPVAAELVARRLGVVDGRVLDAIRYHTTGRARMGAVEQVVYAADKVEPGKESPVRLDVEGLRGAARDGQRPLRRFLLEHANYTIVRFVETGKAIHPLAVEMRNWIIRSEG